MVYLSLNLAGGCSFQFTHNPVTTPLNTTIIHNMCTMYSLQAFCKEPYDSSKPRNNSTAGAFTALNCFFSLNLSHGLPFPVFFHIMTLYVNRNFIFKYLLQVYYSWRLLYISATEIGKSSCVYAQRGFEFKIIFTWHFKTQDNDSLHNL